MKLPKIYWVNVFDEMAYIIIHCALIMSFMIAGVITAGLAWAVIRALLGALA